MYNKARPAERFKVGNSQNASSFVPFDLAEEKEVGVGKKKNDL